MNEENMVPDHESAESTKDVVGGTTTNDVQRDAREAMELYQREKMNDATIDQRQSAIIEGELTLRIEAQGSATPLVVNVLAETIIGRRDPTTSSVPEVDLTPYGGYQMGISRRHATIRLLNKRLDVVDLGSRNGTYLNGERLKPHQPIALLDGDELRLGKIVLRIYFQ
ncbi:MAG: FHA domain-containing protein [Chitinophagaceae bacterium]|nr:FHA domain-containing protein [Anaerolineae bacterium]